jgi:uncharacterized protein
LGLNAQAGRLGEMSQKAGRIQELVAGLEDRELSPYYLGYFACFNRQQYFEAHEVLETVWLPQREGANGAFYKGLIQLAGGFVHLQKGRPGPAQALFKLAQSNLSKYRPTHEQLDVEAVLALIEEWRRRGAAGEWVGGWPEGDKPRLRLQERIQEPGPTRICRAGLPKRA